MPKVSGSQSGSLQNPRDLWEIFSPVYVPGKVNPLIGVWWVFPAPACAFAGRLILDGGVKQTLLQ